MFYQGITSIPPDDRFFCWRCIHASGRRRATASSAWRWHASRSCTLGRVHRRRARVSHSPLPGAHSEFERNIEAAANVVSRAEHREKMVQLVLDILAILQLQKLHVIDVQRSTNAARPFPLRRKWVLEAIAEGVFEDRGDVSDDVLECCHHF
mmetsp:Transcript_12021/g.39568  ORF Transcript_12021/g.39568 Transcript_12021/m.39568 type:complete len:152 (+) Transcript_12021:412-867(+)